MSETYAYTAPGIVAGITPTDADHIYFDANQHSAMGKDYPTAHYMDIRGITYGVSAHLYRWKDGSWNIGTEGPFEGTRLHSSLWIDRANRLSNNSASDAARRKAAELITAIVREWVAGAPEALAQAERGATEEKLGKVQAKIAELEATRKSFAAEAEALRARLAEK